MTHPERGMKTFIVTLDVLTDYGTNPVFVDGLQCWRRYKFGGCITMADPDNCMTLDESYARHRR
jgi:hypothetical protein